MERLIIFIDGSNILHGIKEQTFKIDYFKLIDFLKGDRFLIRAYFYSSMPNQRDVPDHQKDSFARQKKFLDELSFNGIKVKLGKLRKLTSGEYIEKEVDIMLATDMLSLAFQDAFDVCTLVSGDSDFTYTVEVVQSIGKRVENASFKKTSSSSLRRTCDKYIQLDDYIDRISMSTLKEGLIEKIKKKFF